MFNEDFFLDVSLLSGFSVQLHHLTMPEPKVKQRAVMCDLVLHFLKKIRTSY